MTKTENYQLNQWVGEDPIRRTDFNEDNAKLDAALAGKAEAADLQALQTTVAGKAQASALTALQNTVAKKAETSALNALQTQVTAVQALAEGKGDCKIETGSYAGTGEKTTMTITTSFPPKVVIIASDVYFLTMVRGSNGAISLYPSVFNRLVVTWLNNGVSWKLSSSSDNTTSLLNVSGFTYHYVALG